MFEARRTLLVYSVDPIHLGAAGGEAPVDLPVARDVRDGDPILTFTALRGMLRDACADTAERRVLAGEANRRAALSFADARPLLFPARSAVGGFAWVTAGRALRGFAEALDEKCPELPGDGDGDADAGSPKAIVPAASWLRLRARPGDRDLVVLAGLPHEAVASDGVTSWLADRLRPLGLEATEIEGRVAVVGAPVFRNLLGTESERRHRVRVEAQTGTVSRGALFSLEAVPRDTVFYGSVLALSPRVLGLSVDGLETSTDVLDRAAQRLAAASTLTIGGEITVGMGRCRATLI